MRDIHLYLGMLFAPSLLFFAVTGALQLYNLHEVRPGRSFEPPALFQELGMVHKDQVFKLPHRRVPNAPDAPAAQATPAAAGESHATPWGTQLLKAFFLAAAIGLIVSTGLGIWLGLNSGRNRGLAWSLLAAGIVIPVLLLTI